MQQLPYHIKDLDGYIFFSENTQGISGSPVKIHTRLFLDFFCAVDPDSAEGQSVIRDIEALRVNPNAYQQITRPTPPPPKPKRPSHQQQLRKINNTLCQIGQRLEMSRSTKNLVVYYHIHQLEGDKCPTVYISEIHIQNESGRVEGGLYKPAKLRSGQDSYTKDPSLDLENQGVYVSKGVLQTAEAFAEADHIRTKVPLKIFVTPKSAANDIGIWHEPRVTDKNIKLVSQLRDLIRQNSGKKVDWWLDGEGAAIFGQALKGLNANLEKQNIQLMNPRCNIPALLQDLSAHKAQLNNEFITHYIDPVSRLALGSQSKAITEQLRTLPGANIGYNKIAYSHLVNQITAMGARETVQSLLNVNNTLKKSSETFLAQLFKAKGKPR
jgi:hypothetical protein